MSLARLPWPVVLASASPRRRELLTQLVPEFKIDVADLDEESLTTLDPVETAEHLAMAKALAVAARNPGTIVIGGDTVVALGDRQFAKPRDREEAVEMLLTLADKQHRVISAIGLVWPEGRTAFSDTARVAFRAIGRDEAEAYADTGEPMDKAGGYAIQGGAAAFVAALDGELETVIGLPVTKLGEALGRLAGV